MFSAIKNFLYRHRRKFYITGGVVGGLVLLSKYAEYKIFQWHDSQTNTLIEKQKRRQHYEKTRQTANATALSLSKSITKIVCDELDTDSLLHYLRGKPPNKVRLWDELKVQGFSRSIATIYTSALVGSIVQTQLMLLGGYSFGDIVKVGSSHIKISPACQEKYLSHLQNFVERGLPAIISKIHQATEYRLKSLKLDQHVSIEQLEGIFKDILLLLSGDSSGETLTSEAAKNFRLGPWSRFITNSSTIERDEDVVFLKMTEEILDVIDGDDFCLVVQNLVQHGLNHILDYIAEFYPQPAVVVNNGPPTTLNLNDATQKLLQADLTPNLIEEKDPTLTSAVETKSTIKLTGEIDSQVLDVNGSISDKRSSPKEESVQFGFTKTTLPVAKLIPILTDLVHPCLSPAPGHLLQFVLLNEQLENLSFNIYEAFSV